MLEASTNTNDNYINREQQQQQTKKRIDASRLLLPLCLNYVCCCAPVSTLTADNCFFLYSAWISFSVDLHAQYTLFAQNKRMAWASPFSRESRYSKEFASRPFIEFIQRTKQKRSNGSYNLHSLTPRAYATTMDPCACGCVCAVFAIWYLLFNNKHILIRFVAVGGVHTIHQWALHEWDILFYRIFLMN